MNPAKTLRTLFWFELLGLAMLFIAGCGKDSYLKVTEEKVPMPPIQPLVSREHDVPAAEAAFVTGSGAEITFDKNEVKDCARIIEEDGHPPLYIIHFAKTAELRAPTPPRMRIHLYGSNDITGRILGYGETLWSSDDTQNYFIKSNINIDAGADAVADTSRPNSFSNVGGNIFLASICTFRLTPTETQLSGSFSCRGLESKTHVRTAAEGNFKCPLRRSENYPIKTIIARPK
jgi:hypothetical protein